MVEQVPDEKITRRWFKPTWWWGLYAANAYPVWSVLAIVVKAIGFTLTEGRWPIPWRDDPDMIPQLAIYPVLDFVTYHEILWKAFLLIGLTTAIVAIVRQTRELIIAAIIGPASMLVLIAFMILDPGRLFTWIYD